MRKFIVEDSFWELFPQAKIGIVIAENLSNVYDNKQSYSEMLIDAQKQAVKHLNSDTLSGNRVIKVWREAFQKFKTKKGARSSIEALLKRVSKSNAVGTINPLVDIYNSCSMRYALPNGGEDIDKFDGDVRLAFAEGNEDFVTLGSEKSEPPLEDELIYKDDAGAICRCWNWREAVRTMLTEETKNAFLCIESVDSEREEDFNSALAYLQENVAHKLVAKCKVFVLDINNRYIEF
ncbi:B3/B4 domain-containing protein [Fusibacter ferrireducens]|uniref:B3/4 domain-containing protein n=1 Tax=Fusibacter ferrireducens TaxID=2785058 RepID=A0ABR9ZPC4_9FIRM|nr:B3/4 domain-containing protein [Fusibacter ferrireducens]MBF4692312.1 B3/4 domain-containing protein [Fusibacter ferrireducens]